MNQFGYFLLVILLTGFGVYKSAGQTQSGQLSILAGATHDRLIDEAYTNNRLKYAGTNFYLSTSWDRVKATGFLSVSFRGSMGNVYNKTTNLDANLYYGKLAVSYGKRVGRYSLGDSAQQVFLGAELSSANYMMEDILDDTWYTGGATLTFSQVLSLIIKQSGRLGERGTLDAQLVLPFIGWVKRSSYEDGVNQQIERSWQGGKPIDFMFVGSEFKVFRPWELLQLRVQYGFQFSPQVAWSVSYHFRFLNNRDMQPVNIYSNGLATGFSFTLKEGKR